MKYKKRCQMFKHLVKEKAEAEAVENDATEQDKVEEEGKKETTLKN